MPITLYTPKPLPPTTQDKEWEQLAQQFLNRHTSYTPPNPTSSTSTDPLSPSPLPGFISPPLKVTEAPNNWSFLGTANERYLNIFSLFSHQIVSNEWIKAVPSYLPSFLNEKFFEITAPLVGTTASFITQMFIRTFNYDPKLERNPTSVGENLNRTIKSMAHSAVMFRTMSRIFSFSGASISAVSNYFGIQSYLAYAPIWLSIGALSFTTAGIGMILLHSAISKIGVYKAFSNSIDYVTGSKIKEPSKEELQVDSHSLQLTQNLLTAFTILRHNEVDMLRPIKWLFGY